LDLTKTNPTNENIDSANSKMAQILSDVIDALKTVREMCEESVYSARVSSTDKTSLDNHRSYIITALTNVNNSQQTISSNKLSLQKAEDDLSFKKAKPRQEDIDYYQAKMNEAQANVDSLQHQIWDAFLRAPIGGTITKVDKKVGETVQVTESLISLISSDPLQIKVDIYEEDIVKIKVGNPVEIKIVAFPNETLFGRVVDINPAEKLVEGVVYYEVTIDFDDIKESIKPGMTADVVIKTATKENVLTISKEAIRENGKITVLVLKDGREEEREIQIGLEGNDGRKEVVSGLSEGEEVVIK
jgi:RND family efflux transporter MFP subunit